MKKAKDFLFWVILLPILCLCIHSKGANDLQLVSLDSPSYPLCKLGSQNVIFKMTSFGSTTATSASLHWSVNGVSQADYHWKGSLSSLSSTKVKVGTYNFSSIKTKYLVVAYIDTVNGSAVSTALIDTFIETLSYGLGLKGTYSIDKSSGDFKSIRGAAAYVSKNGVCGAVTFNISDGHYNESVKITQITGASATNTVTFQSKSLDSTKVILDTSLYTSSINAYTIKLDGANYISFRKMTISVSQLSSNAQADVIWLANKASNNTFENNLVYYKTNQIKSSQGYVISNDMKSLEENNLIQYNIIRGGYYGIWFNGAADTISEKGNVIRGNIIDSAFWCGIYLYSQDSLYISGNRIFVPGGVLGLSIYHINGNSKTGDSSYIINNFITVMSKNCTALSCRNANYLNIYNTNLFNNAPSFGLHYTAYFWTNSKLPGVRLINNIIYNKSNGNPIDITALYGTYYSDYNDFYTLGGSFTLSGWRSSYPYWDSHSISAHPKFVNDSGGDLHATAFSTILNNKGTPLPIISTDIDGDSRSKTHPDIGADEFTPYINDLSVSAIINPIDGTCGSKTTSISVKVKNLGSKEQDSNFSVHLFVTGTNSFSVTNKFTGILKSGREAIINLVFSPPFNSSAGGTYSFTAYTDLAADSNKLNDTIRKSITLFAIPKAGFISSNLCKGDTALFGDTSIAGSGKISSYLWDFGGGYFKSSSITSYSFLNAGMFKVKHIVINTNGCADTIIKSVIIDSINTNFKYSINMDSVSFSALDTGLTSYNWNFGDSTYGSGRNAKHKYKTGSYKCILITKNANGCQDSSSVTFTITVTGTEQNINDLNVLIYPNPASGLVTVETTNSIMISITNIVGNEVVRKSVKNHSEIDLSNFPKGLYFVKIQDKNGFSVRKLILQ